MFPFFLFFFELFENIYLRNGPLISSISDIQYIIVSFTGVYNTSGANERILVKRDFLNSSVIAPKTRDPFGFPF